MKHSGKGPQGGLQAHTDSLITVAVILTIGIVAAIFGTLLMAIIPILIILWVLFAILYPGIFFATRTRAFPPVPARAGPRPREGGRHRYHTEPLFMGGECQRGFDFSLGGLMSMSKMLRWEARFPFSNTPPASS